MDTLHDLIYQRNCSLTEDEVVAYVRLADPKHQEWVIGPYEWLIV